MTHLLHRGVYKFLSIGACKSALWNVLVTIIMNKKALATDLMLQKDCDISLLSPQNFHSHCCLRKQHHITHLHELPTVQHGLRKEKG